MRAAGYIVLAFVLAGIVVVPLAYRELRRLYDEDEW